MPLVEVIRGRETSDETVATAVAYAKSDRQVADRRPRRARLSRQPPAVSLSERIARAAAAKGRRSKSIERAATDFGMPMGPLALYDMVGLDTSVYAGRVMWEAFPDRTGASPILPAMVKAGRLGPEERPRILPLSRQKGTGRARSDARRLAGHLSPRRAQVQPRRADRPAVLADGAGSDADSRSPTGARRPRRRLGRDLWPRLSRRFAAGLLYWADTLGAAKIVERLKPFEALGPRLQPTPLLLEMAASGKKFYDQIKTKSR